MIIVVIILVIVFGGAGTLAHWARWLGGRYGAPRWLPRVAWVFVGMPAVQLAQLLFSIGSIYRAVNMQGCSAADRQRILANGIAESLYNIAFGGGLLVVGALVMLALTWRYHWSVKPPKSDGSPPYR